MNMRFVLGKLEIIPAIGLTKREYGFGINDGKYISEFDEIIFSESALEFTRDHQNRCMYTGNSDENMRAVIQASRH